MNMVDLLEARIAMMKELRHVYQSCGPDFCEACRVIYAFDKAVNEPKVTE